MEDEDRQGNWSEREETSSLSNVDRSGDEVHNKEPRDMDAEWKRHNQQDNERRSKEADERARQGERKKENDLTWQTVVNNALKRANDALAEYKWDEAIAIIDEALRQYPSDDELRAKKAAIQEAKKAEQQSLYDDIVGNIQNSKGKADDITYRAGFELANMGGSDNYRNLGRSRSRQMSMADDATIAAQFINDNIKQNRMTAFDEAVKYGAAKLNAKGFTKGAENLEKAADLQRQAQDASIAENFLKSTLTMAELFKDS